MAKKSSQLTGELLHFGSVRLRVTGSGVMRQSLISLDGINTNTLPTVTMAATTNKEPLTLANFVEQRAALKVETTAIDEYFVISRIVVFIKPKATGYPQ